MMPVAALKTIAFPLNDCQQTCLQEPWLVANKGDMLCRDHSATNDMVKCP